MIRLLATLIFCTSALFAKHGVEPYLLPQSHPLEEKMHALFSTGRVTQNIRTLEKNGFKVEQKRHGGMLIVSHPDLEGYLLKLYVDKKEETYSRELKGPRGQDEHLEFVGRCRRRARILEFLHQSGIESILIPQKWIFEIPPEFSPPKSDAYLKKRYLLIVEKMPIGSFSESQAEWEEMMNEDLLDDLYDLISALSLRDIGPHNLYFVDPGHLALIDTKEWPEGTNSLKYITRYLNPEMKLYWRQKLKTVLN